MAFVGGLIPLDATVYFLLLGLSLAIAGVSLIVRTAPDGANLGARSWGLASVIGGGLGLLSGMVGIGGGIFLAPILHHLRWASSKTIAALCNTSDQFVSGLAGQTLKTGTDSAISGLYEAIPLLIAVVLGGVVEADL